MKSFKTGQRVVVAEDGQGIALHAVGTVDRIRTDGGAWIALDIRSKVEKAHPFAAEDPRGRNVLAYPESCTIAEENRRGRRAVVADEHRTAIVTTIGLSQFGKDHWSTFAYIETLCVDGAGIGVPDKRRMRCVDGRHPLHAHGHDASDCPTRLRDGACVPEHDDWDCVDDLIAACLMEDAGSALVPRFRLTEVGQAAAAALRKWKMNGGSFSTFVVDEAVAASSRLERRHGRERI